VKRSFVPERKKDGVIFRDDSVKDSVQKLAAALGEAHVI
jgi:hypothetical protein